MSDKDHLILAKKVALKTKKMLLDKFSSHSKILKNDFKDIKIDADIEAHKFISNELTKSNIPIFSEEKKDPSLEFNTLENQWIIDPLDGSLNFHRGFNLSAVSISKWCQGKPLLGVIAPIFSNDIFYSLKGNGSWNGNKKINVSNVKLKKNAILATGFPSGRSYDVKSLKKTLKYISEYKKIRMIGSASMMLCLVADGVFDVYEEEDIYIWDIAAGLAIIDGSNGAFTMKKGSSPNKFHVKASNTYLIGQ